MRPCSDTARGNAVSEEHGPGGPLRFSWNMFALAVTVLLTALISILLAVHFTSEANAATVCDKYAAKNGSDQAAGTKSDPYATLQRLVNSLKQGQTGCLREGIYYDKQLRIEGGGKSLQSHPGERATFRGGIIILEGADSTTLRNLRLDGSYADVGPGHGKGDYATRPAITVLANSANILDNNITNRRPNGNPDLAGQCMLVGRGGVYSDNTTIKGNRVHHCGEMPRINREHGIYASHTRNLTIEDNLVYDNADRGIQLYTNSHEAVVKGNVVDSNAQGLVIDAASSQNLVRNNVFSSPKANYNVYQGPKSTGGGNKVNNNCFWSPDGTSKFKDGENVLDGGRNVVADPQYEVSFKITNSTCADKYVGTLAK
jgi:parallel beta-helix repeat protein